jgi:hypothetical protein
VTRTAGSLPHSIRSPADWKALPSLATGLVLGMPMPASMAWPAVVTALASALFVAVALLRFQRSEL